ncbi:unnamed protein product [Protopolystoma xenopodis]|uniref:AH domain-containing protein n=1 Tax=Protopolystoma xenopodis TaxID=117903 RepID=A0A3S5FFH6_9PLAT|nr:unnamed protein product [Protopolystoma xenopodis]
MRSDQSTTHKLKNAYWTTKQVVIKKLGRKEDEHLVASDCELDSKLELFKIVQKTCLDLSLTTERYEEVICLLSQSENELGRFLKYRGNEDKTQAGKIMAAVGKSLIYSSQQRLALRAPLSRLHNEIETFRNRAVADSNVTIQRMESSRTDYRGALLWMKNVSEELDPDALKQLDRFRRVQAQHYY